MNDAGPLPLMDSERSRALLIGVAAFDDAGLEDLPSVDAGVRRLREILVDKNCGGLHPNNCRQISDPATEGDVDEWLAWVEDAEDTMLIYYAGHGVYSDDTQLHLAVRKTRKARVHATAVPAAWVKRALHRTNARAKVLILDCCFSGAVVGMSQTGSDLNRDLDAQHVEGSFVMTATTATKIAMAPRGDAYTAFTGALLDVLGNGIPDAGATLDMDSIYRRVHRELGRKGLPQPERASVNEAAHVALVRNVAYQRRRPDAASGSGLPASREPTATVRGATGQAGDGRPFLMLSANDIQFGDDERVAAMWQRMLNAGHLDQPDDLKVFGQLLWGHLIDTRTEELLRDKVRAARADGRPLSVQLALETRSSRLTSPRWECLHGPDGDPDFDEWLGLAPDLALSNVVGRHPPSATVPGKRPLGLLFATTTKFDSSQPRTDSVGASSRDVDIAEFPRLMQDKLRGADIECDWLSDSSLAELVRAVRDRRPRVLHLTTQTSHDWPQTGLLAMRARDDGPVEWVSIDDLARAVVAGHADGPRLLVLDLLWREDERGLGEAEERLVAGSEAALAAGFAGVVLARPTLTREAAADFLTRLYLDLGRGDAVDVAVHGARYQIYDGTRHPMSAMALTLFQATAGPIVERVPSAGGRESAPGSGPPWSAAPRMSAPTDAKRTCAVCGYEARPESTLCPNCASRF